MNYWIFIPGVLIVGLVLNDVFVTTLAPRGTGSVTERLRAWLWRFFHWVCRGKGTNKLLNYAGMFTVSAWLLGWLLMLWVGSSLILISAPTSVVLSSTKVTASALDKIYFMGYVLSTMGLGDFQPNGNEWKLFVSVFSFSGFIILTLGITYIVPVLSAEMRKRQTSVYIHSLGTSPDDILLNAWNGEDFSRLSKHFETITQMIMEQSQNHVAYPVLHNFHSHLRRECIYINLAALDEALTILILYLPDEVKPAKQDIYPLRYAITDFLHTLQEAFIKPSENAPGPIELEKLKHFKIPLKQENKETRMKLEEIRFRRKLLLGMMENDGWHWNSLFMEGEYTKYDFRQIKKIKKNQSKEYQEGKDLFG